jgi:DNA-binding transcriptional ArsR family regulator
MARFCSRTKEAEEFPDRIHTSYCDLFKHFENVRIMYERQSHFLRDLRRSNDLLGRNLARLDRLAERIGPPYSIISEERSSLYETIQKTLAETESMSYGELLQTLKTNKATLSRYLDRLVQDGKLERTEVGRNVLYRLKPDKTGQGE